MSGGDTGLDLVTGAFSYSGANIAERLLASGRRVRTLTFHPDRPHPLRDRVEAQPYSFDDPVALSRSFDGVTTLYNTYWVRFDHGRATFSAAIANSRALFDAAQQRGRRTDRPSEHHEPLGRVAASLLPRQGTGGAGTRRGGGAVLDRATHVDLRGRAGDPG